ncbi:hypothetical protein GEMRC1_008408 [Eukaryota sp. GEM-RC1]
MKNDKNHNKRCVIIVTPSNQVKEESLLSRFMSVKGQSSDVGPFKGDLADANLRIGFICKVYALLFVQVLLMSAVGYFVRSSAGWSSFVMNWPKLIGFFMVISFVALWFNRRRHPANLKYLCIFFCPCWCSNRSCYHVH